MIWGLTLEPGKVYTRIVQDELQLSMAIMECRRKSINESNFSHIVMKIYNTEYLLCTLVNGANYQQLLDLKIMPREKVTFSVQGTNTVYLVGYSSLCPDVSHDNEMEVDQDVPRLEDEYRRDVIAVVKEEPSSPHADLGDCLSPSGSLQSHDDPTASGTEQCKCDGTRFESYSTNVIAVVKEEPSSPHADLGDCLSQSHDDPTTSRTEQHKRNGTKFESYSTNVIVVKEEPSLPHADLGDHLSQSHDDPTTSGTEQHKRDGTRFESYSTNVIAVVKEEPSSPHVDLGDRLSPSGSLQSHDDLTTSGTEQHRRDGTSFQSYSTSDTHPSASSWSMQFSEVPPSQSDRRFNPAGQSTSNLGQGTSSEGATVYPVEEDGPSHPPAAFQNFQQSPNKRQRLETNFMPTQETLNNSSGSQFPVPIHSGGVETELRQGPATLGRGTLGTPSMGALGPRSEVVKQSLKSLIPSSGSANEMSSHQRSVSTFKHSREKKKTKKKKKQKKKEKKSNPFICEICDESFLELCHLSHHQTVHSGIKPSLSAPSVWRPLPAKQHP